ncbi:MAG: transporter related protein [Jatrophihabitantaceae bacterium]|nr:transporter related protein [Jatrophihabitantaceae bacterium]
MTAPVDRDEMELHEAVPFRGTVSQSLQMLRPHRRIIIAMAPLLLLSTLATLAGPLILRYGIDNGLQDGAPRTSVLTGCALVYLGIAAVGVALQSIQIRVAGRIGETFVRDLRRRVFDRVLGMDAGYFDRNSTGTVVSRLTSDVDALQDVVQTGGVQFLQTVLSLVLLFGFLVALSWQLTIACLIPVPLFIWATLRFRRESGPANDEVRERIGTTMGALAEGLAGVRIVQAFGQERRLYSRFAEHSADQLATYTNAVRIQARYLRSMEFCTAVATVVAVSAGGLLVDRGAISLGTLSAFVLYLLMLFDPLQTFTYLLTMLQQAGAALRRLYGVLQAEPAIVPGDVAVLPEGGDLVLKRVSFAYGEAGFPVLQDVDLVVPSGQSLALVGPTGAGKSTLAKLAARLHDPIAGRISYGGVDLRDASYEALRSRIVMVSQEGHLFQGTVIDNVRAGLPGATDAQVLQAIRTIGAEEILGALPEGMATQVGERGAFLSAGQRQIVSLARVALTGAEVIILDEATSSMDPGTEAIVHRAVTRLTRGRTLIVIAHRLSTVRDADRIAVIAEGGIAELGGHDELVASGGRYAALYDGWVRSTDS